MHSEAGDGGDVSPMVSNKPLPTRKAMQKLKERLKAKSKKEDRDDSDTEATPFAPNGTGALIAAGHAGLFPPPPPILPIHLPLSLPQFSPLHLPLFLFGFVLNCVQIKRKTTKEDVPPGSPPSSAIMSAVAPAMAAAAPPVITFTNASGIAPPSAGSSASSFTSLRRVANMSSPRKTAVAKSTSNDEPLSPPKDLGVKDLSAKSRHRSHSNASHLVERGMGDATKPKLKIDTRLPEEAPVLERKGLLSLPEIVPNLRDLSGSNLFTDNLLKRIEALNTSYVEFLENTEIHTTAQVWPASLLQSSSLRSFDCSLSPPPRCRKSLMIRKRPATS